MDKSIAAGLVLVLGLLGGCDRSKTEAAAVAPAQGQAVDGQKGSGQAAEAEPQSAPEPVADEAVPADWTETPSLNALRAAGAGAGDQPIAVELSAAWCLPCKELATQTLSDGAVVKRMAAIAKVTVDVTDGTDAQVDIQERLGAATLPHVVIYRTGAELSGVLVDDPSPAEPAVRIRTFVTAAELLGELDAAGL